MNNNLLMYTKVSKGKNTMDRLQDFQLIKSKFQDSNIFSTSKSILIRGDSLEIIKKIPDNSVSLILTDPPYHSTKKKNIYGDTLFQEDEHFLEWMENYANEWRRVLKPNGSIYCFCSSAMVSKIENLLSEDYNILAHIVWTKPNDPGFDGWKQKMKKDSLRQWYAHSERIIFAEPAIKGNLFRSYSGKIIKDFRSQTGLSMKELAEIIGAYGKVNHGGSIANWEAGRNIPNKIQYGKLRDALEKTGKIEAMPDYEDVVRPFNIDKTKEFTDIWTFPNIRPYPGKHPAEKPVSLLEHAIASSTYQNDIVLDCFAGSGSTAIAALKLGRYSISLEIEDKWCDRIQEVIEFIEKNNYNLFPDNYDSKTMSINNYQHSLISN